MVNSSNPAPEILAHRYRVIQVLGEGGFGTTYLAADTQMPSQRQCVVKQLKPMENSPSLYPLVQERFQREAAILEMLGDKCEEIPSLYANFLEDQKFYLVEEWIQGETLAQKVSREGVLDEGTVRQILLEVLPTLAYIHQHKIVHRDIKPDNILLRAVDQKPVLIDFGAVKETMRTVLGGQDQLSQSIVVGTPGFMPSEQMAGYPLFASDLFSLGMTAIYLLTGRMPQMMASDPSTGSLSWHVYAPTLSPSFRGSIDRAIQLHPKERYQSAEEMRLALLSLSPTISRDEPLLPTELLSWAQQNAQSRPPTQQDADFQTGQDAQPISPAAISTLPQTTQVKNQAPWRLLTVGMIGAAISVGAVVLVSNLDIQIASKPKNNESESDQMEVSTPTTLQPSVSPSPAPATSQTPDSLKSAPTPSAPLPATPPVSSTPTLSEPLTQTADPPTPSLQWEYMGKASTGENLSVLADSIQRIGAEIQFRYQIGTEAINAKADCPNNRWYAQRYGWFKPQSMATQKMVDYVCSF